MFFNRLKSMTINQLYRWFKYPIIHKKMKKYDVCSVLDTIKSLIGNNYSLSRFGDGDVSAIFGEDKDYFEKNSALLSKRLLQVLTSNNNNLEVSLPNIFYNNGANYYYQSKRYYKAFMAKKGYKILPYLSTNKRYYNTDFSRLYSITKFNKAKSNVLFTYLKRIWNNKKLLLIEGKGEYLGVDNNLFNNSLGIKRIECPSCNAFESYKQILTNSLNFLDNHSDYVTLISLGPTATVLSYDLSKKGFKAIDIGHLGIEYECYKIGTKKGEGIPDRYTHKPVHNNRFMNQIINNID